jgi:hypothetical protein
MGKHGWDLQLQWFKTRRAAADVLLSDSLMAATASSLMTTTQSLRQPTN